MRGSLRVDAFTGGRSASSARFRVRQYIPLLAPLGIDIVERSPGLGSYPPRRHWQRPAWALGSLGQRIPDIVAGWRADVTLLHREMISTLCTFEGLTRRPRLLDVDDAIHLYRGGRAARRLAGLADLVVVGNDWLAEAWRRWNGEVAVLPTAVDTAAYRVEPLPERPVIGWIGSAGNLRYLEAIAPALAEVARRFPGVSIAVCCEEPPDLPGLPVRYVPWSAAAEADFLASITLGVMPLDDGPWERGKCSFKMLQYLAAGRPCVVSPVGMNREVLAQAEVGLAATTQRRMGRGTLGHPRRPRGRPATRVAGRALVERRYSLDALAPRLAGLIRDLAAA